jgi:cell division protein FtsB
VSWRRRRDGEQHPVDGQAQAVGPRATRPRRGQKRAGGGSGLGDDGNGAPRVRGAWTTPAVVVRGPDGEIVAGHQRPASPGRGRQPSSGQGGSRRAGSAAGGARSAKGAREGARTARGAREGGAPEGARTARGAPEGGARDAAARGRPRVRPRRIPGAPGAVLLTPSLLSDAADGREERRRRRQAATAATVTPLPPRPTPATSSVTDDARAGRARLRPLGGASKATPSGSSTRDGRAARSGRGISAGRGTRGPSPSRPGQRRRQRVLRGALAGLSDRLLPADDEARERRAARLRRIGTRFATVALAVVLVYGVFPVRTWINQREATERARERKEVFERENDLLEDEVRDLQDDERIEELAREMGLVLPGEESYGIFPAPEDPSPPPAGATSTSGAGG